MKRIPAAIRIRSFPDEVKSRLGEIEPFFQREGNDLVFYSRLGDGYTKSEQLVWLHGMLQHDAKILRKIRASGFDIFVDILSDDRRLTLEPNSLLLAHKLGIPTEIKLKK